MTSALQSTENATLRINEKKWSKPLIDGGWTAIPSVIIENQRALGLHAIDLAIIAHLTTFWWEDNIRPHPSKQTLANAVGVTPRTIQRRLAGMEKLGLISREERRFRGSSSATNLYHFDGLIAAAQKFAVEKAQRIAERREERKFESQRRARKTNAVLGSLGATMTFLPPSK